MWEAEPADLLFFDNGEFFIFNDDQATAQYFPESPKPQPPKKQSTQLSKRTTQIYIRKIRRLERRIKELETQLEKINNSRMGDCCNCNCLENAKGTQIDPSQASYINAVLDCQQSTPCPKCLQFQQFEIMEEEKPASQKEMELNGQNWILMGMMMLVMGINMNGFDSTSLDVYKLTKESISSIRAQVQQCSSEIILPIFYSKLFCETPDVQTATPSCSGGFQMEGVRLQSIEQDNLMFEEHMSLKVRYQGLLLIAQYIKQYATLT